VIDTRQLTKRPSIVRLISKNNDLSALFRLCHHPLQPVGTEILQGKHPLESDGPLPFWNLHWYYQLVGVLAWV